MAGQTDNAGTERASGSVPVWSLIGYVLQIVFSLQMIGSMFLVWVLINDAGCSQKNAKWVPYTGWKVIIDRPEPQLVSFPALGVLFAITAAIALRRIRRRTPRGYSIFAGLTKLLTANFLCLIGLATPFLAFNATRDGPGKQLGMLGATGIGAIGLVAVLRRTIGYRLLKDVPPPPDLSEGKSLRILGVIDYTFGGLLVAGAAVCIVLAVFVMDPSYLYGAAVLSLFALSLIILGRGIRRGEGWGAMAHLVSAVILCLVNAVLVFFKGEKFMRPDAAVLIWSIFPFVSAIVFYVLLGTGRRHINWPIRIARCSVCGRRGIWRANVCEKCGNSLRPEPEHAEEYCMYCRTSVPLKKPICRRCRKAAAPTQATASEG